MRSSPSFLALATSLALSLVAGCGASPAVEGEDDSAAITHEEAVKGYEFAELLLDEVQASADVRRLGVERWSVYSASKGSFAGLVMFATDAARDVRYALLVNATRSADGKARIAAIALDRAGKESSAVDAATFKIFTGDSKMLSDALAARTRAIPNSASADCVVGVARVGFTLLALAATIQVTAVITAWAAVGVEFAAALQSVPALAQALGLAVGGTTFGAGSVGVVVIVDAAANTITKLDRCGQ